MAKSVFRIFSFNEFRNYILQTSFERKITFIQNHHTFIPGYAHFNKSGVDHMMLLENMRRDHINNRNWDDIGQNLTIFPDGQIGLCRAIDFQPAGIFGANRGGICIENLGNFDEAGDIMTNQQRDAIVKTNALLCIKFGLEPVSSQVVYHHWYDRNGERFSTADIDSGKVLRNEWQKTCPGTNFFCTPGFATKGNTIQSATAHFYPLITIEINLLRQLPGVAIQPDMKTVLANSLNVRAGRGVAFRIVRRLPLGLKIQVFDSVDGWCRVSATSEEWVSARFLA